MAFSRDQYDAALERQLARMADFYTEPRNEYEPANPVLPNHHRDIRVTPKYAPTPGIRRASSTVVVTLADGTRAVRLASDFRASRTTGRRADVAHETRQTDKRRIRGEHVNAAALPVADPTAAEG